MTRHQLLGFNQFWIFLPFVTRGTSWRRRRRRTSDRSFPSWCCRWSWQKTSVKESTHTWTILLTISSAKCQTAFDSCSKSGLAKTATKPKLIGTFNSPDPSKIFSNNFFTFRWKTCEKKILARVKISQFKEKLGFTIFLHHESDHKRFSSAIQMQLKASAQEMVWKKMVSVCVG